jgi:outer membrane protein OmpA-like peptidoglycan-associated protein
MWPRPTLPGLIALATLAGATSARAQAGPDAPIPPGSQGQVLPFSGEVRAIVGLSSAMAGRVDPLAAVLQDLGARITETEIRIELSADVLFDFDRADLKPAAEASLQKVGAVLAAYPRSRVTVEGHTDAKGSDTYNQALSDRRAASVAGWLQARAGIGADRLVSRGVGARRPVAPNTKPDGSDDPEGRQRNRRVEIVVRK